MHAIVLRTINPHKDNDENEWISQSVTHKKPIPEKYTIWFHSYKV